MLRNKALIYRILQYALLMTMLAAAPAYAQQSFDSVAGSWSGGGWMKPKDGPRERVRCKVDYIVKSTAQSVKMSVRCASDAYKMDLNGLIEAKVESATITALLTVRTKGNRQTFVMESPGAWVSQVSIDLARDPR